MERSLIILGLVLFVLISSGCITQTETQKTETIYVCPTGETVSDPNLCPNVTSSPLSTTSSPITTGPPSTTYPPTHFPKETPAPTTSAPIIIAPPATTPAVKSASKDRLDLELWPYSSDCDEIADIKFKNSPFDTEKIYYIEPMGEMTDNYAGHIVPGDHIAIHYKDEYRISGVDFYAPLDGYLVAVERHFYSPPEGYPEDLRHYHLYFEHSCSFVTGFVHVSTLTPEILDADENLKKLDSAEITRHTNVWPRIPVKAGQKIGTAAAFGMVGMVTVNADVTLSGYSRPESYDGQLWRLHAVAPFDYFEEPYKAELYDKIPRTAEPRGGKINFDIDGKLVGNWFEKDTNGLKGLSTERGTCGEWVCNYWDGHLAIVYDFIVPEKIRISIGRSFGIQENGPYGVKGNSPDPSDIGIGDGLIKYELVALLDVSEEQGIKADGNAIFTVDGDTVLGVFLVQVIEDQTIKVEIFPGETASDVTGFTENAVIYVR